MRPVRSVVQFALASLAVVVLLGLAAAAELRKQTRDQAIQQAKDTTRLAGEGIARPALTPGVYTHDPKALVRIKRALEPAVLKDPVVRIKIWTADGRILWSDEPRLIGRKFDLDPAEVAALRTGRTDAGVSDLTAPENFYERHYEKLLQVYLPISGPDGRRLLFESYSRYSSVATRASHEAEQLVPLLVGALGLLWLATLPLAWRLARRLELRQREREALLQRAIDAQDSERRRIAGALHDDVVQDLAGLGFSLSAAAARSESPELREAADQTRQTMRKLRAALVDIYPPSLQRAGLHAAIDDLAAPLAPRVEADVPDSTGLPPAKDALIFRMVQEGLRNVAKHADAKHVKVSVEVDEQVARAVVEDDGRGFSRNGSSGREHMGLSLLTDLAEEAGGRLTIDSRPGQGTRLILEVPVT